MMSASHFIYTGESCLLSLNYAWYHIICCLIQFFTLWACGNTKNFRVAHAFGLFALVMDYGINYLHTGSRIISYPHLCKNLDNGTDNCDEAMGPLGTFLFFIWFDYSAFGFVLWAFSVEEYVKEAFEKGICCCFRHLARSPVNIFAVLILPIQFWTAPIVASWLRIDGRTVLLVRHSPKLAYAVMVIVFPLLLYFVGGLGFTKEVLPVLLSGFGCGIVHHAALFSFGMRRYTDLPALILTLCTEWPALIMGIAVMRRVVQPAFTKWFPFLGLVDEPNGRQQGRNKERGTKLFVTLMWIALVALIYPHVSSVSDKDAMAYLIPSVPGQHMQSLGTAFLRVKTCILPQYIPSIVMTALTGPKLNCWGGTASNNGEDMLVMASAAKSGAVLSARIVAELGSACGLCVASGERSGPGIPGPVESVPVYRGQILHAIVNMHPWPEYVQALGYNMNTLSPAHNNTVASSSRGFSNAVRCIVLVRDPLSRLRSLYTYARSGGEHWFRYESGLMQQLGNQTLSLEQSLGFFWLTFGKAYLEQSHEYTMMNIRKGCFPVKMEDFKARYNDTLSNLLHVYGLNSEVIPDLVRRLASADESTKSPKELQRDAHFTSNKFSASLVHDIKEKLLLIEDVRDVLVRQRDDLSASHVHY